MNSIKEHDEFNSSDATGESSSKENNGRIGRACTCGGMSSSDMMMTIAIDNEKQKSINICGADNHSKNIHKEPEIDINNGTISKKSKNPAWLESSFVHLMTPRNNNRTTKNYDDGLYNQSSGMTLQSPYPQMHQVQQYSEHGFLERHQLMLQLLQAAHLDVDESKIDRKQSGFEDDCLDTDGVELCFDCIDRVASALDADTQRLYAEVDAYQETIRSSKQRWKMIERTTSCVASVGIGANLASQHSSADGESNSENKIAINKNTIEEAYQEEIDILEREIEMRNEELLNYKQIFREQKNISEELCALEEDLQQKENSLELQSEAFDNRRQVLTKTLAEVQNEVDKLTCVSLPRILFDLQVDQARGLHYPLINQLRLAFRPKGDVPAQEIQVAWSQATQLLLVLGTLLEYPGKDWKLVPLADCAKLIYRKEVFNLVPGDCRSLMAWNALLDQVVKHAMSLVAGVGRETVSTGSTSTRTSADDSVPLHKAAPPPYSSSPTMIGNTELGRLDPTDHVGWSQVIHRMASNLLWLSNRASRLSATQVSSLAHCVV